MVTKAEVQHIRMLSNKRYSHEHEQFVVEGEKLVKEALDNVIDKILFIILDKNKYLSVPDWIDAKFHQRINYVDSKQSAQISSMVTPPGILLVCNFLSPPSLDIFSIKRAIYLHEISDAGNLGTIIRTADWFGIETVLCSSGSVDKYNQKTIQASMGSVFRVNTQTISIEDLISFNAKLPLYAFDLSGDVVEHETKFHEGIYMFGNESHGLPDEIISLAQKTFRIPNVTSSKAESLNLAISVGIICSKMV